MSIQDLQAEIIAIDQEIAQLENSVSLALVKKLLNLIERVVKENNTLLTERQQLRDEINRLKGEQGKPDIKANKKNDGDISSEAERKEAEANANKDNNESGENSEGKKKRQREPKLPKITINREQICLLDKTGLPDDLVFKDYEDVVIQDLIITTNNVNYRREVYYSASTNKSYRGELPAEVRGKGEYGPGIRALIPILKSRGRYIRKADIRLFSKLLHEVSAAFCRVFN